MPVSEMAVDGAFGRLVAGLSGPSTAVLVAGIFCVASEALLVSPLLRDISLQLGVPVQDAGLTVSAYGFALAVAAPFVGALSDTVSRKTILTAGLFLFSIATLLCGLAPNFTTLLLARAACGAAAGAVIPTTYAFVGDAVAYEKRARVMGFVMSGWALAMAVGVPLGGVLGQYAGWRGAFFALGGLSALTAFLMRTIPAVHTPAGGGSRNLLRGFSEAWRVPTVPAILLVYLLHMAGFYGMYTYLGTFIQMTLKTGSAMAGSLVICYGIGLAVSTWNGKYFDRIGKARAFLMAEVVQGLVLMAIYLAARWPPALCVMLFSWGLTNGVCLTSLASIASQASAKERGSVMALSSSITYVGVTIAAAAFGLVYSKFGYGPVALACGGCLWAAAAVFRGRRI